MNARVTLIIPCLNEEPFIGKLMEDVLRQDYPHDRMEVLVVDGMSTDHTREILSGYARKYPFVKLIDNPRQYVPFALNLGVRQATGDLVLILGAHSQYPPDYVSSLVKASGELDADNVGGLCTGNPPDGRVKSLAIARLLSCPFGVGNAYFRTGSAGIRKVDTVTFGCYKRSVFDRIGLFDEELLRNQDDEFNGRLIRNKGTVYLVPGIVVTYFTRSRVSALIRMFYQYGLFKPLVSRKLGRPATVRQLVPFLFVGYLILTGILGLFYPVFGYLLAGGVAAHLLTGLYFTIRIMKDTGRPAVILYLPWLFFAGHIAYGWGYLTGILRFIILRQKIKRVKSTR
ncbi:MAG TPA: glycosyltransferase family 2 protein [Bacteroidales bacterium]|nr:glycosyltransferase family 2 protein [Bacteroidales bacterium]